MATDMPEGTPGSKLWHLKGELTISQQPVFQQSLPTQLGKWGEIDIYNLKRPILQWTAEGEGFTREEVQGWESAAMKVDQEVDIEFVDDEGPVYPAHGVRILSFSTTSIYGRDNNGNILYNVRMTVYKQIPNE